jgi:hypothetical protein
MLGVATAKRASTVALALAAAAMTVAGCGADDEPATPTEAAQPAPEATTTGETTTAQPPPESAEQGDESSGVAVSDDEQEAALEVDSETGPQPCGDVEIAPDSGNGLFDVEADGITCEDAAAALESWGASGYPGTGPPGFSCEPVPEAELRLSCEQEATDAVLTFTQGN